MEVTLKNVEGNQAGKYIYSVIILDEDDLSQCRTQFYCGNDEDEIAAFLKEEDISEMNYVMRNCGERNLTSADL